MAMITVQVWDATGNKRQEVELPDDAPVNRILSVLLDKMQLPQTAPDGQPLSYKFHHKRSGKQLLDEQCLADVGVEEGDVLRLNPEITAGASSYPKTTSMWLIPTTPSSEPVSNKGTRRQIAAAHNRPRQPGRVQGDAKLGADQAEDYLFT